jgi:type IV pilus assembly protein PilQ
MSSWTRIFLIALAVLLPALPAPSAVYGVDSPEEFLLAENEPTRGREQSVMDASPPAPKRTVTSLGVVQDPMGSIVSIIGSGSMEYEYFLIEGKNLVIDVYDAVNEAWPTVRNVDGTYLRQVRIGEHFKPRQMVRILLELKAAADFQVRDEGSQIIVSIGEPGARPAPEAARPRLNLVSDIRYLPYRDKSRVELKMMQKPEYTILDTGDPRMIAVEIADAQLAPTARTALDLSDLERELRRVDAGDKVTEGAFSVGVTAQLNKAVPFRVSTEGTMLFIDVDHAADTTPFGSRAPSVPGTPSMAGYGRKVSLDFVDADIRDILRLISDVAGTNFAAGDEVKGRVSIRLIDVPWEIALDTLLMTNNPPLVQVPISENIVRITTGDKVLKEQEQQQKKIELERRRLQAERQLEEEKPPPIETREFSISYARLADERGLLSSEGSLMSILETFTTTWNELFTADPRTNTIIVRDSVESLKQMESIIRKLDTPTYAVVVEARIVEVSDDVSESLGIRWNASFNADPGHGNALPFAFPNSVGIQGETTAGADEDSKFMVNLPASNPTAAVGISFGHIASTFSLDLQLSAMEEMGKTKVLSSPKILVIQNEKATINIGDKLPVPQTDAEGNRTVEFEPTGIRLEVTPQVTNDGRVFMDILIEKSQRGDTVPTTDGPMFSINSRDAKTKVLVGDGETAVIGGLLQEESTDNRSGVPKLSNLPLLGWMFRSKTVDERRTELLIFLTPRIVPRS